MFSVAPMQKYSSPRWVASMLRVARVLITCSRTQRSFQGVCLLCAQVFGNPRVLRFERLRGISKLFVISTQSRFESRLRHNHKTRLEGWRLRQRLCRRWRGPRRRYSGRLDGSLFHPGRRIWLDPSCIVRTLQRT